MHQDRDIVLLFLAKIIRMFSYGALSVVFIQALVKKEIKEEDIGFLQSLIAFGDIVISLYLTTKADKLGRQKTLTVGACLKVITGIIYATSNNYFLLAISGIVGVLSVTGSEIGPFVPIEQAALVEIIDKKNIQTNDEKQEQVARIFGYYNMFSYLSQACGAAFSGFYMEKTSSSSHIMLLYSTFGLFKFLCYRALSPRVEPAYEKREEKSMINLAGLTKQNTKIIAVLSSLFILDTFGGGFVNQAFLSFYYQNVLELSISYVGLALFVCNIMGGISGIISSKIVKKIGPIATMIFTHLPSNIFLITIGACPKQYRYVAVIFLILRFCISQMDVPARQTYVSMVVSSEQRSAANGITNIARSVGIALAFPFTGYFLKENSTAHYAFYIGGILKIIYDLILGYCFLKTKKNSDEVEKATKEFREEMEEIQQNTYEMSKDDLTQGNEELVEPQSQKENA